MIVGEHGIADEDARLFQHFVLAAYGRTDVTIGEIAFYEALLKRKNAVENFGADDPALMHDFALFSKMLVLRLYLDTDEDKIFSALEKQSN